MKRTIFLFTFLSLCNNIVSAQNNQQKITAFRKANEQQIINEYLKFIAIPDETNDTVNIPLNAAYIMDMLAKRNVHAELLTPLSGNPAVFAEVKVPGATKTINFYAHYDGQPVNAKQWAPGLKPVSVRFLFQGRWNKGGRILDYSPGMPVDPEWRLTGRASADDKASVMCIKNAYDALQKNDLRPGCNIKFVLRVKRKKGHRTWKKYSGSIRRKVSVRSLDHLRWSAAYFREKNDSIWRAWRCKYAINSLRGQTPASTAVILAIGHPTRA